MHVGLVVYDGLEQTSGGYRYDRKLVDHLERRGVTVDVLTIPDRSYARNLTDNLSRSLRDRLNQPFDVLLQDELCHPSLLGHNRALDQPECVVSLVHLLRSVDAASAETPLEPVYRTVEHRYLSQVDGVLCTSQHTKRVVDGVTDAPSTVAYPGGRTEGPALARERVIERASEDPLRILSLGSVVERKGLSTLVSALDSLGGEWTATVVGRTDAEPDYFERITEQIADLDNPERIDIRGGVSDAQLERHLEQSHVLCLPSRYESFGMAYLEAMEYGVVPIATTVGGPGEFVEDGTTGILIDPGDVEGLRETLELLRDDREQLATLARGALDVAAVHPAWERSMDRARSFLERCVEQMDTTGDTAAGPGIERGSSAEATVAKDHRGGEQP